MIFLLCLLVALDHFDYHDLHVMGLIDPLIKLPKIFLNRRKLLKLFISNNIDVFIGVDSPDFNIFFHKKSLD